MKCPVLVPCVLIVGLAGCGYGSLNSVLLPSDVDYDGRLLGTWQDPDSGEKATIVEASGEAYLITYVDEDGKAARFRAQLGELADRRVLELAPLDDLDDRADVLKSLLLPLYGMVIIDSVDEEIRFRLLEPDSIRQFLVDNPGAASHLMQNDRVVLTGSTAELRAFFGALLALDGILGEETVWQRVDS